MRASRLVQVYVRNIPDVLSPLLLVNSIVMAGPPSLRSWSGSASCRTRHRTAQSERQLTTPPPPLPLLRSPRPFPEEASALRSRSTRYPPRVKTSSRGMKPPPTPLSEDAADACLAESFITPNEPMADPTPAETAPQSDLAAAQLATVVLSPIRRLRPKTP